MMDGRPKSPLSEEKPFQLAKQMYENQNIPGLLASFGEMGSFGGLAPFSCPQKAKKNRVIAEGGSSHYPRGGSRAPHVTKIGQEPIPVYEICKSLHIPRSTFYKYVREYSKK